MLGVWLVFPYMALCALPILLVAALYGMCAPVFALVASVMAGAAASYGVGRRRALPLGIAAAGGTLAVVWLPQLPGPLLAARELDTEAPLVPWLVGWAVAPLALGLVVAVVGVVLLAAAALIPRAADR